MTNWRRPLGTAFGRAARRQATALAALLAFVVGVGIVVVPVPLAAQGVSSLMRFPPRPPAPPRKPPPPSNAPMLVQATEIRYDYSNNSVAAVGNVQIYYGGATIDRKSVV